MTDAPIDIRLAMAEDVSISATRRGRSITLTPAQFKALAGLICNQDYSPTEELGELVIQGVVLMQKQTPQTRQELERILPSGATVVLDPDFELVLSFVERGELLPLQGSVLYGVFIEPALAKSLFTLTRELRLTAREMVNNAMSRDRVCNPNDVYKVWRTICRKACELPPLNEYVKFEKLPPDKFRLEQIKPGLQRAFCPYSTLSIELWHNRHKSAGKFRIDVPMSSAPALGTLFRMLVRGATSAELIDFVLQLPDPDPMVGVLRAVAERNGLATKRPAAVDWDSLLPPSAPLSLLHVGHATLLIRGGDTFALVDPWFTAGDPDYSSQPLVSSQLPKVAAMFITHEHWDHINAETILRYPENVPVVVPKQDAAAPISPRYREFLNLLGVNRVVELGHWESMDLGDGLKITAVPFVGEGTLEEKCARNCYLAERQGARALVHVDSSMDSLGNSDITYGIVARLRESGAVDVVYATRRQELHVAFHGGHELWPLLMGPDIDRIIGVTENCHCPAQYLSDLARETACKKLILYSEGGADWYPAATNFLRGDESEEEKGLHSYEYLWDTLEEVAAQVAVPVHLSLPMDLVTIGPDGVTFVRGAMHPATVS